MFNDCPFCFRPIGTHTHDPILLPNGAPNDWISDTEIVFEPDIENRWYKGFYQVTETDIIELQTELTLLEVENGITPLTEFSPVNPTGKFQITGKHIKELRDSVEGLLNHFGLTKTDYFNYDEEGNHITQPNGDKVEWTDPITIATDLQKFQIKAIHIEDLRHFIQTIVEIERWNIADVGIIPTIPNTPPPGASYLDFYSQGDFYGDIGDKPAIYNKPWYCKIYTPPSPNPHATFIYGIEPMGVGMWNPTITPFSFNLPIESTAEIIDIDDNNILKNTNILSSYVFDSQVYPPPNGWYPYGNYGWQGSCVVYTSGTTDGVNDPLSYFIGIFKKGRPIITVNKIFNIDLTLDYLASQISSNFSLTHIEYPRILITVTVKNDPLAGAGTALYNLTYKMASTYYSHTFTPSFSYAGNNTNELKYLTDLAIGANTLQLDLYENITKRLRDIYFEVDGEGNPILDPEGNKIGTMKYIDRVTFTIYFDQMFSGIDGFIGAVRATGTAIAGHCNLELDNIGLVAVSP